MFPDKWLKVKYLLLRILLHIKAKKKGWRQPHPNTHTHIKRKEVKSRRIGKQQTNNLDFISVLSNKNRYRVLIQINLDFIRKPAKKNGIPVYTDMPSDDAGDCCIWQWFVF
ncbi:hypothetical protein M671_07150 [Neisseria gonorrhoeae CH811]|nr:hypothetical protein M680_05490 [Neisseria gonorrhoeae SK8976]KLR96884.1 hypothetical protein M674_02255 [Neisseria gonorrhoeae SK708]KLT01545.1 hypothetical protein M671_07150 [Neisseria gonorrhoeae CH811]